MSNQKNKVKDTFYNALSIGKVEQELYLITKILHE